jgi:nuclear-control-of-ATPase protein 2
MSFVLDQVNRIDSQLDRLQLANLSSASRVSTSETTAQQLPPKRILALQAAIRALSPSSSSNHALLKPTQIQFLLSSLSDKPEAAASIEQQGSGKDEYETELEWLLASKATTQVYGLVLDSILRSTVRLANDIYYWDEILSSRRYTTLYGIQTSPIRFWAWSTSVWEDVKERSREFSLSDARQDAQEAVTQSWSEFYSLVRQVVRERSVEQVQKQVISPVTRMRNEVRKKQKYLKNVRLRNANALGVLLGEGLANESVHGEGLASPSESDAQHKWKVSVSRNVALMEAVLAKANDTEEALDKFDTAIAELTEEDPLYAVEVYESPGVGGEALSVQPQAVAERLSRLLTLALPQYAESTQLLIREHGRPSKVIRYWLPVVVGALSAGTVLRILVNRKADIIQWIEDLGGTMVDFWRNWVVEPTRKVIKTIRHDEGSEVSIMSKRSLEGDRNSLERMVVEFAIENPSTASDSGAKLSEGEIADIRAKVREGDLTPVLKAYEKDLASPFKGTVRGNLIRALLIQIQKTKVDVEVAMGGIDSLLKSQELVFGFVGLTPGILVTYFLLRSLQSSLSEKRGSKALRKQGKLLRQLRNIDRILVDSNPTDFGELLYRDQGLLLCEVHVLRQAAEKVMPGEIYREFSEEAEELCDVRIGVEKQRRVLDRIRWAYGRWL